MSGERICIYWDSQAAHLLAGRAFLDETPDMGSNVFPLMISRGQ
jgi:hypothetical protein